MGMKWNSLDLPWEEPKGKYGYLIDDGPAEDMEFEVLGVKFEVKRTEHVAVHSGRTRYFVRCVTCDEILHEATTGPRPNIENHMEGHGWKAWEIV